MCLALRAKATHSEDALLLRHICKLSKYQSLRFITVQMFTNQGLNTMIGRGHSDANQGIQKPKR